MKNVEIRKIKKLSEDYFKAKIDVAFQTKEFGNIVIKGFRIANSKFGGFHIKPPSYKIYGNYFEFFFLENKEKYKNLQKLIATECRKKGVKINPERTNEDVNPKELPKDL